MATPKIPAPNYTQFPNAILDNLPELSFPECKLVMAVCRKTFGYHKRSAVMSYTYIEKATGMTRPTVASTLKALEGKGWLHKTKEGDSFAYELAIDGFEGSKADLPEVVKGVNQGSKADLPEVVKGVNQKVVKEINTLKKAVKERGNKTTPQASPAVPLVPDELDTEDFARAWDAWAQFREGKGNPILPAEEAKIHKELSKIGHDNAIKLISEAIIMNLDKIPSPYQKFIDRWSTEYKARFGQTYFFTGGKDGSAVKRLVSNGLSVDQLVELFTKAWATDAFFCQKAVSICGFASNINQIRAELSKPSHGRPMSDSLNMSSLLTQKRELEKTFVKIQAELQYDHNRTPDKLKAFKEAKDKMSQINAAIEGMNRK